MEKTTRRSVIASIILLMIAGQMFADEREIRGKVGYIAGETVYVDIGRSAGIEVGDSLHVERDGEIIGTVVVVNSATNASSCESLFPVTDIRVGDEVSISKEAPLKRAETKSPASEPTVREKRTSRLDGTVSIGSILSEDLTDTGLGFSRPSMSTRFRIRDIAGKPLSLDLRHRSRYYSRESRIRSSGPEDRWTHQIYRLSLTLHDDEAPYQVRLGRFLSSYPRGLGIVDGLLLRYRLRDHLDIGVVGGFRPDSYSAEFRSDEKIIGAFTAIDLNLGETEIVQFSTGFTGNYRSGAVNREYFVSEGVYSRGRSFSASGSVEIDLNRDWKLSMGENRLDLTRVYVGSRYRIKEDLSLNLSYDNRRSPRTFENRDEPDSLFDDSRRRGFHAGASWSATPAIHVSGVAGVRFREGFDNTFSASGSARIREFPSVGMVTTAKFSMFRTMFIRAYRPMVTVGLKPVSDFTLNVGAGDIIYDTGGERSHDPSIQTSLHYWITHRQFLTIHFTGHLSERRRSARLSGETGIRF